MKVRNYIRTATALIFLSVSGLASAQSEVLYVTDGDSEFIKAIQGGSVIDENLAIGGSRRYRVAVGDTIWLGDVDQGTNIELDLNLDPTGNTSGTGIDISEGTDGATDGSSNYSVESFSSSAGVYQFNSDWSGGTLLFSVSGSDIVGITYDPINGSLWISDETTLYEYNMAGVLQGSFPHAGGRGSLAYEGSTDTFWYVSNNGNELRQYSRGGSLLSTVNVAFGGNVWGAEMVAGSSNGRATAIPIPTLSSLGLIALILLMITLGAITIRRNWGS